MCCRYWADETPETWAIVQEMERSPLTPRWEKIAGVKSYGEIRPTDVAPVIAPDRNGNRAVFPMRWGFGSLSQSAGRTVLMNARTETASSKPTFREAWERHRCIVPASGYFEWEHIRGENGKTRTGDKYLIRPKNAVMTWLCGLYRIEEGLPVFVILTREPGEDTRFIHDRMPLILPEECIDDWISPDRDPGDLLSRSLTGMDCRKAM